MSEDQTKDVKKYIEEEVKIEFQGERLSGKTHLLYEVKKHLESLGYEVLHPWRSDNHALIVTTKHRVE